MEGKQWCNVSINQISSILSSTLNPLLKRDQQYQLLTDQLEENKLEPTALAFNYVNYLNESNRNEYLYEQTTDNYSIFNIFNLFQCWQTPSISNAVTRLVKTFDVNKATLKDAEIWDKLGLTLFDIQMYRESDMCYDMSLKIFPNDINVLYHKGVLCQITGQKLSALRLFEQVINLCETLSNQTEKSDQYLVSAIFHIGVLQFQLNRIKDAENNFKKVLCYDKKQTAVLLLLADCLERQFKYSEAAALLEEALSIDPNNFRIKKTAKNLSYLAARSSKLDQQI